MRGGGGGGKDERGRGGEGNMNACVESTHTWREGSRDKLSGERKCRLVCTTPYSSLSPKKLTSHTCICKHRNPNVHAQVWDILAFHLERTAVQNRLG